MKKLFCAVLATAFLALAGCSPKTTSEPIKSVACVQQQPAAAPVVNVRTDVPNKAFYKDLFVHCGLHLDEFANLPYIKRLDLSWEYILLVYSTRVNRDIQNSIFSGNENDANGVLLYPDGEPRFRMVDFTGGLADQAGIKLETKGRENVRTFIANGGSYVGNCAGAYITSVGTEKNYMAGYIGLWPGRSSLAFFSGYVGYILPKDSPLLKYYDFGGDNYVEKVRHNNGPYFELYDEVPGTEVLTINDYTKYKFHNKPSAIAYKADCYSGRVIPIGGHPEKVESGEQFDLMTAYVRYALDGQGCAKAKAILSNGEMRRMTKSTEDEDPAYTKIGDKQCHHFVFGLPKKARNVVVRLESLENYELSLRLANGTFAFKEDAQYAAEGKDLVKELKFDELPAGTWYIGVQCENTVEAVQNDSCCVYSNTAILNGAPYTISVKWDEVQVGKAVLSRGTDVNEIIKRQIKSNAIGRDIDTVVTKIVFKTGDNSAEGLRIDDRKISEEPVYAKVADGVVTISTPAKEIYLARISSFLFNGFSSLKTIENIEALRSDNVISLGNFFTSCKSLESVNLSHFNTSSLRACQGMFNYCTSMKKVDLSGFSVDKLEEMSRILINMPKLEEVTLCRLDENVLGPVNNLFVDEAYGPDSRTSSKSGSLDVKCCADNAKWLVENSLKPLINGTEKSAPVTVRLFDAATGAEIKVDAAK